jgi:RHS repeat-associated protein
MSRCARIVARSAGVAVVLSLLTVARAGAQQSFADDPLVVGVTQIKAVHLMELRTRIDALRRRARLAPYSWTDAEPAPGVTLIRAVHLQELRTAMSAAATGLSQQMPTFGEGIIVGSFVTAAHIAELRALVKRWELCAPTVSPTTSSVASASSTTSFSIATGNGCGWTATSDATWLSLGTSTGTSSLANSFTVSVNTSGAIRTGTITVGAQALVVTQLPPPPAISSLSAVVGSIGNTIVITGINFGSSPLAGTVTFSGVPATVASWTPNQLSAIAPSGATSGNVIVSVNAVASNAAAFTVLPATIHATPTPTTGNAVVTVSWQGVPSPTTADWFALFASDADNATYLARGEASGRASDTMLIALPPSIAAGSYQFRLFANGSSQLLAVGDPIPITNPAATLGAAPAIVVPEGTMSASWQGIGSPTANDWIGLFPVGATDAGLLATWDTTGAAADAILAPLPDWLDPGQYELRLFSSTVRMATSNAFTAVSSGASINVSPAKVTSGGIVSLEWRDIPVPSAADWVGLVPIGAADAAFVAQWTTRGAGTDAKLVTLPASLAPGQYEFRLFSNGSTTRLAVSNLTIVEAAGANTSVDQPQVGAGGSLLASWTGIVSPTALDWIAIVPVGTSGLDGVTRIRTTGTASGVVNVAVPASLETGTYEARLLANDTTHELARSNAFMVSRPDCSYTVSAPTPSASGGATVVDVAASDQYCAWTVSEDSPWLADAHVLRGYGAQVVTDGAIGYWRLDESAAATPPVAAIDVTGYGRHGTYATSGVTLGQIGATADGDGAAKFDGSGSVTIGDVPALAFTGAFTAEAWVNLSAPPVTYRYVAGKVDDGSGAGWALWISGNEALANAPRLQAWDAGGHTKVIDVQARSALSLNAWHYVAASWDGTSSANGVSLYVDGVRVAQATATNGATIDVNTQPFRIGGAGGAGAASHQFNGLLDEVAVYASALSGAQIAQHYALRAATGATGSGIVTLEIAANTNSALRTASLTVGQQIVGVSQDPVCSLGVSPDTATSPAAGGIGSVAVSGNPDCGWTSAANVPWLSVAAAAGGYGAAVVADQPIAYWRLSDRESYAQAVLSDQPAGYWRFGEASGSNALDSTGHGRTGLFGGSVTHGLAGARADGSASALFDGATAAVTVPNAPTFQTSSVSIEAWVKPAGSNGGVIASRWDPDTNERAWSVSLTAGTPARVRVATSIDGISVVTTEAGSVTPDQWHHVVATISSTAVTAYVDGIPVVAGAGTVPLLGSNAPVRFGRDGDGGFLLGGLQDAAIYGYVVSPEQVANHFARRTSIDPTVATAMAADASGHGRTATYAGGVTLGQPGAVADGGLSASFDGSTGAVVVNNVTPFKLATQSVEFWMRRQSSGSGAIAGRWDTSANQRSWLVSIDDTSGQLVTQTSNDGVAVSTTTGVAITTGVWHHVAVVTAGASVRTFVDGMLAQTSSGSGLFASASGPLRIGREGTGSFFSGQLSDVAIYASALSADQIAAHYARRAVAGDGLLTYAVAPNPFATPRTGSLMVAGQTVAITQDAADCVVSVVPSSFSLLAGAQSGTVNITTNGCGWSASTTDSWLTLAAAAGSADTTSLRFTIGVNPTFAARAATFLVGGQTVVVSQRGLSVSPTATSLQLSSLAYGQVVTPGSAVTLTSTVTTTTYQRVDYLVDGVVVGSSAPNGSISWTAHDLGWHLFTIVGVNADGSSDTSYYIAAAVSDTTTMTIDPPPPPEVGGIVEYYHTDAIGSVRMTTDESGAVTQRYDYLPFGEAWPSDPAGQPRRFTGKERDQETGLDYFGARLLSSSSGRFTSVDPSLDLRKSLQTPQQWNRYLYALNSPLSYVDPDGRWPTWFHHQIIEEAIRPIVGFYNAIVLERASDWVDSIYSGNQSPSRSFMHSMRDGDANQSVAAAQELAQDYIDLNIGAAVNAQLGHQSKGGTGFSELALNYFGRALHTVTDASSPQHTGYQPWYGLNSISSWDHKRDEAASVISDAIPEAQARAEARAAALRLWIRFQDEVKKRGVR